MPRKPPRPDPARLLVVDEFLRSLRRSVNCGPGEALEAVQQVLRGVETIARRAYLESTESPAELRFADGLDAAKDALDLLAHVLRQGAAAPDTATTEEARG